jgi:predicted small lipoprotein YifL
VGFGSVRIGVLFSHISMLIFKPEMTKPKNHLIAGLIFLIVASAGCGQKGPLYLEDTAGAPKERAEAEDEERQKDLEGQRQSNERKPEIAY